eukprot:scaffold2143_cov51-Isochrysis_galbana.AAC.1
MCPSPPVPLTARPSAPAVPQISYIWIFTSLSVPVLASVGGALSVRHTHPASHTSCLPCVPSAV